MDLAESQKLVKLKTDCQKLVASALESSLVNKRYSDVTIMSADGVAFQAHKVILAGNVIFWKDKIVRYIIQY